MSHLKRCMLILQLMYAKCRGLRFRSTCAVLHMRISILCHTRVAVIPTLNAFRESGLASGPALLSYGFLMLTGEAVLALGVSMPLMTQSRLLLAHDVSTLRLRSPA